MERIRAGQQIYTCTLKFIMKDMMLTMRTLLAGFYTRLWTSLSRTITLGLVKLEYPVKVNLC